MSKYLEFKEVPFKGKTKRFEVISKNNPIIDCPLCFGTGIEGEDDEDYHFDCRQCNGTGSLNNILGRIQWYPQWRQYTFRPSYTTFWNKDCLGDIQDFLIDLMAEHKTEKIFEKREKSKHE